MLDIGFFHGLPRSIDWKQPCICHCCHHACTNDYRVSNLLFGLVWFCLLLFHYLVHLLCFVGLSNLSSSFWLRDYISICTELCIWILFHNVPGHRIYRLFIILYVNVSLLCMSCTLSMSLFASVNLTLSVCQLVCQCPVCVHA